MTRRQLRVEAELADSEEEEESVVEDRNMLSDALEGVLRAVSNGIEIGKNKDFAKENSSPIIGRYIDGLTSLMTGSLPGSRHLETRLKANIGLELDPTKVSRLAKRALVDKIISPAESLLSSNFNPYLKVIEDSADVFKDISASKVRGDSSVRAEQLASELLALEVSSAPEESTLWTARSRVYKTIYTKVLGGFRDKFSAITTFSLPEGLAIVERVRSETETSSDIDFIRNLFTAIIEWAAYVGSFSRSLSGPSPSTGSGEDSEPDRSCDESVDDLMGRVDIARIDPGVGMSYGAVPGEVVVANTSSGLNIASLEIALTPKPSFDSSESIELINNCYKNYEYIEWMILAGVIDTSRFGGSDDFPTDLSKVIDTNGVTTTIENAAGAAELLIKIHFQASFLRSLGEDSIIFDIRSSASNITIKANDNVLSDLLKLSSATTTSLYETTSPSGERVIFTPTDLVVGSGKVKGRSGKAFRPKKITAMSLADQVSSPSYGKVKKRKK